MIRHVARARPLGPPCNVVGAVGATRFDLKYGMGGLSHGALMTNIELYGTQVIPRVRELLADDWPLADARSA
ncbi:MAG TPA: hypothetical protein VK501_05650 [Baekduia sp.]|nr:hypothetical protein [Baekduia sp.]HMJ33378.1 hypothetical protein [Baekduia sp.]